jgi:hypothetical protein
MRMDLRTRLSFTTDHARLAKMARECMKEGSLAYRITNGMVPSEN